jgi:hypothetical protein
MRLFFHICNRRSKQIAVFSARAADAALQDVIQFMKSNASIFCHILDPKMDITWQTKYVLRTNLGSRSKKRTSTCHAFLPRAAATSPGIKVGRYLFSEPNSDLTKRTELSVVIRWTEFVLHVTCSLFPFSICGNIFGIRLPEIRKTKEEGSANYSVYFIALIRFLTNYHDTENCLPFPVLCCVLSLPPKWRRDRSVFPHSRIAKGKSFPWKWQKIAEYFYSVIAIYGKRSVE